MNLFNFLRISPQFITPGMFGMKHQLAASCAGGSRAADTAPP